MTSSRLFIIIAAGLTIASCNDRQPVEQKPTLLSNFLSITDNEDKGVKEILEFYGGYCKYAVGASASSVEGKEKYFELEMSKCEALEKYSNVVEMPASNIAYLFYRNLKDEKNNYDKIHTVIILKDNSKIEYIFSKDQLELVDKKMIVINKVVDLIKTKNFEGIKPYLNPDTNSIYYNKNELITNLAKVDPQFGTIIEFIPYGFRFDKLTDGRQILHISGVLSREKQNNNFSVDIDPTSTKDEIIMMQYKL